MPLRALCLSYLSVIALAAAGCSAIIDPDEGRLGVGDDGGSARRDGAIAPVDAGPRRDAGPTSDDGGASECESDAPRCEGDALVTCVDGVEVRQDCRAAMAYCAEGACQPWVCEPSSRECSEDGTSSVVCNDRGSDSAEIECPGVCDPETGRCGDVVDACSEYETVAIGSTRLIELCLESDDNTHTPTEGCATTQRADGPDTVFRLDVPVAQTVTIELTDDDSTRAIDTIVYVRETCDDASSQVACDDDVLCTESTVPPPTSCISGYEVRQSRIETRLEAGTYYIVVDAFEYTRGGLPFVCGDVRLAITGGA